LSRTNDLGRRGLSDEAAVDELASSEDAVSEAAATKDTLSELDVYELRHDKQAPVPSRVLERAASADAFKAWPFNIEPVERAAPKRIVAQIVGQRRWGRELDALME